MLQAYKNPEAISIIGGPAEWVRGEPVYLEVEYLDLNSDEVRRSCLPVIFDAVETVDRNGRSGIFHASHAESEGCVTFYGIFSVDTRKGSMNLVH